MLFFAPLVFFILWQAPLGNCYDLSQFQNMVVFGDSLSDNNFLSGDVDPAATVKAIENGIGALTLAGANHSC